jgi:crossover junction endodeoxyribonuclease RuvC
MKNNPASAIKLGHARAACLIPSSLAGIDVGEYSPRSVKKSVVGTGAADKSQVAHMINVLLPYSKVVAGDAADALGCCNMPFAKYEFFKKYIWEGLHDRHADRNLSCKR